MKKLVFFLFLSLSVAGIFSPGFAQTVGEAAKDTPPAEVKDVKTEATPAAVTLPAEVKDVKTDAAPAAVTLPAEVKDVKTDATPPAVTLPAEIKDVKTEATPPAVTLPAEVKDLKTEATPPASDSKTEAVAKLSPGLYHYEETGIEFAEEEDGISGTGSQKMQMDLKADGTFTITTWLTIPEAGIQEQVISSFRGNWRQDGEKLIQSGILAQYFNFETNSFSPWEAPDGWETEITVNIRNVTPGTFQEYDEESKTWATWSKL